MESGAIDLHKRRSQIRIVGDDGGVVLERRVDTSRADLDRVFAGRAALRIVIESSTESEWVAQHLETRGHEVVVVDPNYAPTYGARTRKVKTDKRDAAALAEACRTGIQRRAHRASAAARALRRTLRVRQQLVRQRAGLITLLRALLRQEGIAVPSGSAERMLTRVARVSLPPALVVMVAPLRAVLTQLNATLAEIDETIEARATDDAVTQHLMTAPGVGPVVALTFQAVLDDPARFGGSVAERRGRRIAIVALARRLSRILFALWRDRQDFSAAPQPTRA